ncbi:hypothetical protein OG21DRAFT_1378219, partial [Imleria badia]
GDGDGVEDEGDDDNDETDNNEGWVDESKKLSARDLEELKRTTCPMKAALLKTLKLGYKIIHSTTILLPAWREIFEKLKLKLTYLPRNVATRWNSTFDMLDYVLQH